MKSSTWWIFALGIAVLWIGTGSESGVTGKDEYWVTLRTPLEMIEDSSYWTLRLNDEVRLQKPPLVYWFLTLVYQLFGVHLSLARLVGVLSGAGMAAIAVRMYERLFRSNGILAGLAVLATAGVAVEGRRAMLDMPLGMFSALSVYLALSASQERKSVRYAFSGMALAAATLAKGPQSLLFVLPALLLGVILLRDRFPLHTLWKPACLLLVPFLLLTVPWPLSMRILHADFIAELETQIVGNRLNKVDLTSPLNALGGALLLSIPWSFLLIHALVRGCKRQAPTAERWLCGWLLLSILPFFFMKSFERYMIPILPCAGILIAWTLDQLSPAWRRGHSLVAAGLLSLVGITFSLFGWWFHLSLWTSGLTLAAVVLLIVLAARCRSPLEPLAGCILVFTVVLGILYPRFGINRIPDDLPWEELHTHRVGIYSKYSQPAMMSMRLQRSVEWPREDRLNADGFDGYIFTTRPEFLDSDPDDDRIAYLDHALRTAGIPYETVTRYPVFFSRRNWIRFTRPGTTREDWAEAFRNRNLDGLKSEIILVRTLPNPENPNK